MSNFVSNPIQTKFGRGYVLTAKNELLNEVVQIQLPFTIEFDISRTNYASSNFANIRIYNLSAHNRKILQVDQYATYLARTKLTVTLQAGYGTDSRLWPTIFSGVINRGYSVRQGTEFVTVIEAFDAGNAYRNAFTSLSPSLVPEGTPIRNVIIQIMKDLAPYGVTLGYVGNFEGAVAKAQSYFGPTIDLLTQLTNQNFFIDLMKANALLTNECLPGVLAITPDTGLLETPIVEKTFIKLTTLFEPAAKVGMSVNLQAGTNVSYNGQKLVAGVHHRGVISSAIAGEATTAIDLRGGNFTPLAQSAGLL